MDAATATARTHAAIDPIVAGLRPEHREANTPCAKWNVHDLMQHICGGGHMMASALAGEQPPEGEHDFLAEGPQSGWSAASARLADAATPERLEAMHDMPFGRVPGEMALSVITADHLTHGWDLARATGQQIDIDDDLAEWALAVWQGLVPAEGREGDAFAPAVSVAPDSPAVDRLVAYTGRTP